MNGQVPVDSCFITNPLKQEVSPALQFTERDLSVWGDDMCANNNAICNSIVELLTRRCFDVKFKATCEKTCNGFYQQGKAVKAEVMKDCCDITGKQLHLIYSFRDGVLVTVSAAERMQ